MGEIQLNLAQQKAVESASQNLLILAGPGTGKTRVLIERIRHQIKLGTQPEKILALTFSRRATSEMEERLHQAVPSSAALLEVSTLHSFCLKLVEHHSFRLGLPRRLQLITKSQALLLMRQLSPQLPLQQLTKSSYLDALYDPILDLLDDCKDEGIWPEQLLRFADTLPSESTEDEAKKTEWKNLAEIYHAFQSYCFDQGCIDFGDAVLMALQLLDDHPAVKEEVHSRYDSIFVDEFQDTNWTQIQLLRHVVGPNAKVTVVGDDDQSIYRFRGASYSAFKFFEESFPNRDVVELNETYRLAPEIAAMATELIAGNQDRRYRADKKIHSKAQAARAVRIVQAHDYYQEAEWVVARVKQLVAEGISPSDIAVIVRAHHHADLFAEQARRERIPLQRVSQNSVFETDIGKDLISYCRLLVNPTDSLSFMRLLDSFFLRLGADEIYKFCEWAKFQTHSYVRQLENISNSPLTTESKARLKEFDDFFKTEVARSARVPTSDLWMELYKQSSAIGHMMEKDCEALRELARLHRQIVEWESLQINTDFRAVFPLLDSMAKRNLAFGDLDTESDESIEGLRIMTAHASKGLEFDTVFILSLVGRRFPGDFRPPSWRVPDALRKEAAPDKVAHIDEERRLLYVGVTRAKRELNLCTVEKNRTKPSVFLPSPNLREWTKLPSPTTTYEALTRASKSFERISAKQSKNLSRKSGLELSFTQLEKFEKCPQQYWFSYELRIPVAPSPSLSVGSAVHEALENLYKAVSENKTPTAEQFMGDFKRIFDRENEKNSNLSERDYALARSALANYYGKYAGKFPKPVAVEASFELHLGPHKLRGKIDRVDAVGDGVRIVDYKTGNAKSSDEADDRKFAKDSLQFSIYALAAKEFFKWNLRDLEFYYIYHDQSLISTRSDEDLVATREKIVTLATQIQEGKFEATPGRHCRYCEFNLLCPVAEA